MADAMDTLKGLLGDGAEDKIKSVIGSLADNGADTAGENVNDTQYMEQMRNIINKMTSSADDSRSRLLTALKPYMSEGRKKSIDSAVRLLNIARLAEIFRR